MTIKLKELLKSTGVAIIVCMSEARRVGGSLKFKSGKSGESVKPKPSSSESSPAFIIPKQKTAAELAFEAAQKRKQAEVLPELAKKSHKDKVAEYNEYLGKLSEHHDIPKVGPG